jgi:hypothetical protein
MPLLFQGHTGQLEEFLSRSREQQVAFVQLLDHMISRETNMDVLIRYDDFCKFIILFEARKISSDSACIFVWETRLPVQILKRQNVLQRFLDYWILFAYIKLPSEQS